MWEPGWCPFCCENRRSQSAARKLLLQEFRLTGYLVGVRALGFMMWTTKQVAAVVLCLLAGYGVAPALDLNGNQQSDVWEWQFGATGLAASADADVDGVNNAGESVAGTDPFDPVSVPRLLIQTTNLWWSSVSGKLYRVEATTNLQAGWSTVATFPGTDASFSNA